LLLGYATDQKVIGPSVIREVIGDMEGLSFQKKRRRLVPIIVIVSISICLGAHFLWGRDEFFKGSIDFLKVILQQSIAFYGKLLWEIFEKFLRIFS